MNWADVKWNLPPVAPGTQFYGEPREHTTHLIIQYNDNIITPTPCYLHERLRNNTFLSVWCSAGEEEDSVHSQPWLKMTGDILLAVADVGQQEQLP